MQNPSDLLVVFGAKAQRFRPGSATRHIGLQFLIPSPKSFHAAMPLESVSSGLWPESLFSLHVAFSPSRSCKKRVDFGRVFKLSKPQAQSNRHVPSYFILSSPRQRLGGASAPSPRGPGLCEDCLGERPSGAKWCVVDLPIYLQRGSPALVARQNLEASGHATPLYLECRSSGCHWCRH